MNRWRIGLVALVVLASLMSLSSCRALRHRVGLKETVSNPSKGTPEWVIQEVLRAALEEDEEVGWRSFARLLHSEQKHGASLDNWRSFRYRNLRGKVNLYLKDREAVSYEIVRVNVEDSGGHTYFIYNQQSDPTPCTVLQDERADNAWRISRCSL